MARKLTPQEALDKRARAYPEMEAWLKEDGERFYSNKNCTAQDMNQLALILKTRIWKESEPETVYPMH